MIKDTCIKGHEFMVDFGSQRTREQMMHENWLRRHANCGTKMMPPGFCKIQLPTDEEDSKAFERDGKCQTDGDRILNQGEDPQQ